MVSLRSFRIQVRKGRAYPTYLTPSSEAEFQRAVDYYEERIGRPASAFDEEEVKNCFSDSKIIEACMAVLSRYYSFKSPTLEDLLGPHFERLKKQGISSCVELRLRFFEYLSAEHDGFMDSASRREILEKFASTIGLSAEILEDALWIDEEENKTLCRQVDQRPKDLFAVFNLEMLSTIMSNCFWVELGPLEDGSLVKFAFRNAKFYGLLFETHSADDGISFKVFGPLEIFHRPNRYGYRIMLLVYRLWQLNRKRGFDCNVKVSFRKSKRRVELEAELSDLPQIAWPNVGELRLEQFDSKVEAKIYSTFNVVDLGGWRVEREPRPIVLGKTVFIPDFSLSRGRDEVLVEVIGFWLPEYKEKKKKKLREMERVGLRNLLLLVDRKIEDEFRSMTDYPIFSYSRVGASYRIPYSKILSYLDKVYPRGERETREAVAPRTPKYVTLDNAKYKVFW